MQLPSTQTKTETKKTGNRSYEARILDIEQNKLDVMREMLSVLKEIPNKL